MTKMGSIIGHKMNYLTIIPLARMGYCLLAKSIYFYTLLFSKAGKALNQTKGSLRSKRFRLFSEQRMTEERDFRFSQREK